MASKLMNRPLPRVSEKCEKNWVSTCNIFNFAPLIIGGPSREFAATLFVLSSLEGFSQRTTPRGFVYRRASCRNGGSSRKRNLAPM